jgi:phosphotransacetylase
MKSILNFTQHDATPEQLAAGVVEPYADNKERIRQLLTFNELPTQAQLRERATDCAVLASVLVRKYGCDAVLIGGAPFFMSHLESALRLFRVRFCYAFSTRVAEEQMQPDGSVRKTHVFKHVGFISPDEEENA